MKAIAPKSKNTKVSSDAREWIPSSFSDFLLELGQIESSCEGEDPLCLFRGQADYRWLLDSTFVRNSFKFIFKITDLQNISNAGRNTVAFNRMMSSLLLFKFDVLCGPSKEALLREQQAGIDPWYEFLRDLQQYPDKYRECDDFIKGTFLLDLTYCKDISLYFTVFENWGQHCVTPGHGALWIFDAGASGKIHTTKKLGEIIAMMRTRDFSDGTMLMPHFIHPGTQTFHSKADKQKAVYILQGDYRCDIANAWVTYEEKYAKRVFIKLILKEEFKAEAAKYLVAKGLTNNF